MNKIKIESIYKHSYITCIYFIYVNKVMETKLKTKNANKCIETKEGNK